MRLWAILLTLVPGTATGEMTEPRPETEAYDYGQVGEACLDAAQTIEAKRACTGLVFEACEAELGENTAGFDRLSCRRAELVFWDDFFDLQSAHLTRQFRGVLDEGGKEWGWGAPFQSGSPFSSRGKEGEWVRNWRKACREACEDAVVWRGSDLDHADLKLGCEAQMVAELAFHFATLHLLWDDRIGSGP